MSPNLFLVYVTDVDRSTDWYSRLFEMQPTMRTPRYVSFEVAPDVTFAVWSGRADRVRRDLPRTSEVGLMVPDAPASVDEIHERWRRLGVDVVEEPHDAVFGRTLVVADPDGNLVRVSPVD